MTYDHDVFISHASEDKKDIARPLADKLIRQGYRVWYDEFSLTIGDSLINSIDQGLSESRLGIIVLSPNFINKAWPQHELEGLVQKELKFGKVILPIWHQVSHQEVLQFSPTLANKLASLTSKGLDQVTQDIIAALEKQGVSPVTPNKPEVNDQLNLEEFAFNTVKLSVGRKGFLPFKSPITSVYRASQARYFVEDLGFGVTLEMLEIPGGTFLMGTAANEQGSYDDERPKHQVTVPSFFMGKYAVTQEQWEQVAATYPKVKRNLEPKPSCFQGDDLPVERVSWYDAVEFCARLSRKTGRSYSLPSEAQWEYACRAGTTTPFYFGETITTDVANYDGNYTYGNVPKGKYRAQTTTVGSFPPNYFGLYDMHGNVWEWCLDDWHNNYDGAPTNGRPWFADHNNLDQKIGCAVLRGGSWVSNSEDCRSASRNDLSWAGRDNRSNRVGFRVVCAVGRIF